jgi:hypothetical protein
MLTRASLVWFVGGNENATEIIEPTADDVAMMYSTMLPVTAGVAPPPSKADQTGEKWSNFMSYFRLHHDEANTAWQLLRMERDYPVRARHERKQIPLFGPRMGEAFAPHQLDQLLKDALQAIAAQHPTVLSADRADRYSWHSFRIGLASRLKASNCDDATIQACCRWATTTSIRLYARMGRMQYADILDAAAAQQVDSVQAATLWKTCPHIDDDHNFEFAARLATDLGSATDTVLRSLPQGGTSNDSA